MKDWDGLYMGVTRVRGHPVLLVRPCDRQWVWAPGRVPSILRSRRGGTGTGGDRGRIPDRGKTDTPQVDPSTVGGNVGSGEGYVGPDLE